MLAEELAGQQRNFASRHAVHSQVQQGLCRPRRNSKGGWGRGACTQPRVATERKGRLVWDCWWSCRGRVRREPCSTRGDLPIGTNASRSAAGGDHKWIMHQSTIQAAEGDGGEGYTSATIMRQLADKGYALHPDTEPHNAYRLQTPRQPHPIWRGYPPGPPRPWRQRRGREPPRPPGPNKENM